MAIGRGTAPDSDFTSLLDAEQVARLLGLSPKTVKAHARTGVLPGRRLPGGFGAPWRFDAAEVLAAWRGIRLRQEVGEAMTNALRAELTNRMRRLFEAGYISGLRAALDKFAPGGQLRDVPDEDLPRLRAHLMRLGHRT